MEPDYQYLARKDNRQGQYVYTIQLGSERLDGILNHEIALSNHQYAQGDVVLRRNLHQNEASLTISSAQLRAIHARLGVAESGVDVTYPVLRRNLAVPQELDDLDRAYMRRNGNEGRNRAVHPLLLDELARTAPWSDRHRKRARTVAATSIAGLLGIAASVYALPPQGAVFAVEGAWLAVAATFTAVAAPVYLRFRRGLKDEAHHLNPHQEFELAYGAFVRAHGPDLERLNQLREALHTSYLPSDEIERHLLAAEECRQRVALGRSVVDSALERMKRGAPACVEFSGGTNTILKMCQELDVMHLIQTRFTHASTHEDVARGTIRRSAAREAYREAIAQEPVIAVQTLSATRQPVKGRLPPSTMIDERYEIIDCIGVGAFGEVYAAFDTASEVEVALKIPAEQNSLFADELRGAKATKGLPPNAHVARYLEGNADAHIPYYTSDLVDGVSLDELSQGTELHPVVIEGIAQRLLTSLAYLHRNNILHLDLKPSNVMLAKSGDVVIVDTGNIAANDAAAHLSRSLASGTHVTTALYMAPEVRLGRRDVFCDLYSAGAIIYELATGIPLAREDAKAVNAGISDRLNQEINRLTRYIPEERPTAYAAAAALNACPLRLDLDVSKIAQRTRSISERVVDILDANGGDKKSADTNSRESAADEADNNCIRRRSIEELLAPCVAEEQRAGDDDEVLLE